MFNPDKREREASRDLGAFIRRLSEARIAGVQIETVVDDLRDLDRFIREDLPSSANPLQVVSFRKWEEFRKKLDIINEKVASYQRQIIADESGFRPELPLSVCFAAERVIVEEFPEAAYAGDIRKNATLRLKLLRLGALILTSLTSALGRISGKVEVPSFGASYAELRNQLARAYRNLDWGRLFQQFISPLLTEDDLQAVTQVLEIGATGDLSQEENKTQAVQFLSYLCRKLEALANLSRYVEQERQEQFLELQRKLLGATRALLVVARKKNEKVEEKLAQAVQIGFEELCSFNQQLLKAIIRSEIIDPFVSKYCNLWSIFGYVKEGEQGAFILSLKRGDQLATVEARPVEAIKCPFSGPLAREVSKRVNA